MQGAWRDGKPPRNAVAMLQSMLARGLRSLDVMASPPTITQLGPNASNNTQATGISGGVLVKASDVIAGTDRRFTMQNPAAWTLAATSNDGVKFYSAPNAGGNDIIPTWTFGFYCDGPTVEICNRGGDNWQVFVDGSPVSSSLLVSPTGTSYRLCRTSLAFGSRKRRKFVCYGQTSGFYGIGIGAQDSLEPLDFSSEINFTAMTDSYGGTTSLGTGGLFWYAAMLLGCTVFRNSSNGGSGYDTAGNGNANFLQRLATMTAYGWDVCLTSGGINDGTFANAAPYYAQLRASNSLGLIIANAAWTPNSGAQGAGATKRDSIFAAINKIAGPWIFIDNVSGTWKARSRSGYETNGLAGGAPWQTGNGKVGGTTGSGNGDFYCGDGTHPYSPDGTVFLGMNDATAGRDAIMSMVP